MSARRRWFALPFIALTVACARSDRSGAAENPDTSSVRQLAEHAADSSRSAAQCPPHAIALQRTLVDAALSPDDSNVGPFSRSLPHAWGPFVLGMTTAQFTSLTGLEPEPCRPYERPCSGSWAGRQTFSSHFAMDGWGDAVTYRALTNDSVSQCAVDLEATFFRDTLISIDEIRRPPRIQDSLRQRFTLLYGAPARTDSDDRWRYEDWNRVPITLSLQTERASPHAALVVSLIDRSPQLAAEAREMAGSIRQADSIVRADSTRPTPGPQLPRRWGMLRLGMTETEFARAAGVEARPTCFGVDEVICPPGAAAVGIDADTLPGTISKGWATPAQKLAGIRRVYADFYGGRLFRLFVTKYHRHARGSPSAFDSLREQALSALGPPDRSYKEEGVEPTVEWQRGPAVYFIRTLGSVVDDTPVEEVSVSYLDCRLAPADYDECRQIRSKRTSPP